MFAPIPFASWRDYFKFTLAREFVACEPSGDLTLDGQGKPVKFAYTKNIIERIGKVLSTPVMTPADFFVRNIKNPLMISALAIAALLFVSIAFYPAQTMAIVYSVFPFLAAFKPWMAVFACYIISSGTILGLGLQAIGRCTNQKLLDAWVHERATIRAVAYGEKFLALNPPK